MLQNVSKMFHSLFPCPSQDLENAGRAAAENAGRDVLLQCWPLTKLSYYREFQVLTLYPSALFSWKISTPLMVSKYEGKYYANMKYEVAKYEVPTTPYPSDLGHQPSYLPIRGVENLFGLKIVHMTAIYSKRWDFRVKTILYPSDWPIYLHLWLINMFTSYLEVLLHIWTSYLGETSYLSFIFGENFIF